MSLNKAEDAVAVVAVVLGGVDSALGGDGVRPTRGIMIAKAMDVVALLAERGSRRRSRQTCADNDDRVLAAVGGIDELHLEAAFIPLLLDWTGRYPCFQHSGSFASKSLSDCRSI